MTGRAEAAFAGGALAGVKVLDLSRVLAGPWCTQILGDFGADVLKVENLDRGDDTRSWGPPYLPPEAGTGAPGASAYYLCCNRNKRSVGIDIARPEGAALVRRLACEADVLVENFKVGGLAKYGLDYESLRALNPRLVYCSVTGFGQEGPYADRPGYDFVAQAMGGMMSITGEANGPPIKPGVAIADLATGMYAVTSVLVALRVAEQTGQGQHIDCALLDSQIALLANQASSFLVSGASPQRLGNAHPTVVPYRVLESATGPIVIAIGNDGQFRTLCEVMGLADLAADDRFRTNADRVRNRAELERRLEARAAEMDGQSLIAALTQAGAPAGPVNDVAAVFADPHVAARGLVRSFQRADGAAIPTVAFPAQLSETPARYERAPPARGADTADALADWLGLAPGEIDALSAARVVG